eukprot:5560400-Prymnesium_polylepis.1
MQFHVGYPFLHVATDANAMAIELKETGVAVATVEDEEKGRQSHQRLHSGPVELPQVVVVIVPQVEICCDCGNLEGHQYPPDRTLGDQVQHRATEAKEDGTVSWIVQHRATRGGRRQGAHWLAPAKLFWDCIEYWNPCAYYGIGA